MVSQGSVAMLLRSGGIFNDQFITQSLMIFEHFQNRTLFGEVMGKK